MRGARASSLTAPSCHRARVAVEVQKLKKEKGDLATKLKDVETKLKSMELELKKAKETAAAADARVEVAAAAAAGQAREMVATQVADAYKEGMAAARTFLKDMRSLF